MLIEITLEICSHDMNIHSFSTTLNDTNESQKIGDVSLHSNDYMSVMFLPINSATEDDFGTVKYYVHSEEHKEWNGNNWEHPLLYDYQYESNKNDDLLDDDQFADLDFWKSKDKCIQLVDEEVLPLHDKHPGKVTSFRYIDGKIAEHTAKWKVRYFKHHINESRAYRTVEYGFDEIVDLIKFQ